MIRNVPDLQKNSSSYRRPGFIRGNPNCGANAAVEGEGLHHLFTQHLLPSFKN